MNYLLSPTLIFGCVVQANELKRGITDAEIALTVTPGSEGEVSTLRACLQVNFLLNFLLV